MKLINFGKKSGFSLMELTMALLIVAILLVITLPIVNRQLKKSEEYSYFLAYKTIEKMAGQIVALGDPEDETAYVIPQNNTFKDYLFAKFDNAKQNIELSFKTGKAKFAALEFSVFTKLFPKAFAVNIPIYSWSSSDMDDIWLGYYVCRSNYGSSSAPVIRKGEQTVQVTDRDSKGNIIYNADGTPKTHEETVNIPYSKYDFNCCYGYTQGGNDVTCKIKNDAGEFITAAKEKGSCPKGYDEEDGKCYATNHLGNISSGSVLRSKLFGQLEKEYFSDIDTSTVLNIFWKAFQDNTDTEKIDGGRIRIKNISPEILCNKYKAAVQSPNTAEYTNDFSTYEEDDEDDEEDTQPHMYSIAGDGNWVEGTCSLLVPEDSLIGIDESALSATSATRPTYGSSTGASDDWCKTYKEGGVLVYTNMWNYAAPTGIDCQPRPGYILSANNDKVACARCAAGQTAYATGNASSPCLCTEYEFNETTHTSCGPNAIYTGGTECECVTGWIRPSPGADCTKRISCPKGTSKQADGTCVTNPPIVDAKRFCELVDENWNVSSHKCDNFVNGVYEGVYIAALGAGTNHTYLSIESKPNAFKYLTPNLVLSNGLKMWILGNKAASIPGLSYFPDAVTKQVAKDQNMCVKVPLTTYTNEACRSASDNKGYFCLHDKNCFKLTDSSYATGKRTTELYDARGCCANSEVIDFHRKSIEFGDPTFYLKEPTVYAIAGFTVFVDINGDKGEGTLWEDVFPFYISSDGTVYPGYPLDAEKDMYKSDGTTAASNALYEGGNSDSYLPVDVYYFESDETGEARVKKVAFPNVSFARGVCSARKVSRYTPYCKNLGKKYKGKGIKPKSDGGYESVDLPEDYIERNKDTDSYNPCDYYTCYVSVKNKLRFF